MRRPGAISRASAADGIAVVGPGEGEMAERGEAGIGRMAEPLEIVAAAEALAGEARRPAAAQPLAGKRVLVTSGPTHEPIDPVRYIANRSSGKQGHAIAAAAAAAGAQVILISGPVTIADPIGVKTIRVETAREMLAAVEQALPVDCAVFAAAVADWRVAEAEPPEDQEAERRHPGPDPHGESRHSGDRRPPQDQAAPTGDRLRGRDREGGGERAGQAQAQRLRLDRGQ